MSVWQYATVKKYEFEMHSKVSMSWILGLGPSLGLVRVPGIGLVYTELASGVPHIFSHFITNLPAIYSVVVFVCVKYPPVYTVPEEERFLVKRIGPKKFRMFRCVARYGYKDLHRKDDDFENKLLTNLSSFIRIETMMETALTSSTYSSAFSVNYTQESRDELLRNNSNHNNNNMDMFSSMVDYTVSTLDTIVPADSPRNATSFSQNYTVEEEEEDELEFLKTCKESGVVHIMGDTVVKARNGSWLPKKIAIDYVFAFLDKICRENSVILHVPHETLLNVGQVLVAFRVKQVDEDIMLGSGNSLSRGTIGLSSDAPNLSQVLTLEPIRLGNPSYTRSGELRRVLGVPSRASSEDNSFGMSHPKPSPPGATEELKHFKESVQDTSREAGDLAKKLSESIFKLDKYAETLSSKKRRRNDTPPGERMDAANFDKVRNQVPRTLDSMAQRPEERKKMLGLNKRARTTVGDVRADGRVSTLARQQVIEKGSDSPPSVSGETVRMEEKIRRLPVGGEGWEARMKRKRSVATLGNRVMNPDQQETASLARDRSVLAEQRLMAKGNNKRNLQDDSPTNISTAILKGKVSRAPRTAAVIGVDSSSKVESPSGVVQGSSAHGMAQWGGQRLKNSRTRRTNVVSPVIRHAETKFSAQGFATSDFSPIASPGTTGSLSVVDSSPLKVKRELKNASSPYGLSESEDSGAGDNKTRERALASGDLFTTPKTGSSLLPVRKNKFQTSHKGGGAWKQGKNETVYCFHPGMVKSENLSVEKPLHNVKIASDKNRSKYGRPPAKKVKDRKPSTRLASNSNSTPSNITGESDDDREDIFAAANSARKAANLACSGKFWKKMDHIFAAINTDDMQNIKDQLNFAEELDESLSEAILDGYNIMGIKLPKTPHRICEGIVDYSGPASSCKSDLSFERLDMRKLNESTPLYKRVLSALIEEDDGEEVVQFNGGKNLSLHYASDDSHSGSCTFIDTEFRERDRMEFEVESSGDFQTPKSCLFDRFSSERSGVSNPFRNGGMFVSAHSNEQWLDDDLSHSDAPLGGETFSNGLGQLQAREVNIPNFPVSDTQYQLMSLDERLLLELQSIGVFPEAMPDLAEETMSTDVMELKESIYQQIRNKKEKLEKLNITIQKGKDDEKRKIEHLAMDHLVETAHKKRMASRGNKAYKVHKVTRQAALAFTRRTLARCQKFDETGLSCFADPALRDILFSSPSNDAKSSENGGSGTASNTLNEPSNHQAEAKGSGAVSSTKRREALIDDVIGCASSKVTTSIDSAVLNAGGAARGKRSEREDSFRNKNKPKPKEKNNNENQTRSTTTTHPTGPAGRGTSNRGGTSGDGAVDEEAPIDFSKLAFHDLEEIGEQADIGNWFEGLQDIDTAGLDEVPMDDLSFMFG
ncbi:hypothetical protein DY000_02018214 [Brassica cretica]|uniref:K+ potassium transporter C-terminal domain-containing protein n=1 Tax=Brassica cretica TaxID=69181 RepID=A0ABQ7DD71_BRACR|nr:hypothetical protein DY000_02018214 [Brassica cretica]